MLTGSLEVIINDCWRDFNSFSLAFKVMPSIPILWFGDMEAYQKSKTKIVTVALNPSEMEFKINNNGCFSIATRFGHYSSPFNPTNYYETLNDYFKQNPYWGKWFRWPEQILNCLGASYKNNKPNTALHLDIYAPVATTPHWNGLTSSQRHHLSSIFKSYFDRMMEELHPDIIVASLNKNEIAQHFTTNKGKPCIPANAYKVWCPPTKPGFDIRSYQLSDGKILITGRNMGGTAFGGLSANECRSGLLYIYP